MPHIQMRRDTAANWKSANPVLESGEWALETDTKKMKLGNGTSEYNSLDYFRDEDNEWEKPEEWIDIRSAALPNSVYFLVGHSADYSTYPDFGVKATISNSGTYDVYIDGRKRFTVESGTGTTINWQSLALVSGWDVTYPSSLKTHVVRVTPSDSSNTLTAIQSTAVQSSRTQGILWVHFTVQNAITIFSLLGNSTDTVFNYRCEAITSSGDVLKVNPDVRYSFLHASIKTCPTLDFSGLPPNMQFTFGGTLLRTVKLLNTNSGIGFSTFGDSAKLEKIENNTSLPIGTNVFSSCSRLRKLPTLNWGTTSFYGDAYVVRNIFKHCTTLDNTEIDASPATNMKRLTLGGESEYALNGIKGLTVSNEAPFDNATSPQLDVSYTGLDRAALVNLFKSMPYNVGYTVAGRPTIVDGVVSGFSASDYLIINNALDISKDFGIMIKFKYVHANSGLATLLNYSGEHKGFNAVYYNNSGVINFYTSSNGTTYNIDIRTTQNLTDGTNYYFKIINKNNTVTIGVSSDLINWDEASASYTGSLINPPNSIPLSLGHSGSYTILGSIDLKETYITVNGGPWFNGAATRQLSSDMNTVGSPSVSNGVATNLSYSNYYESSQNITYNYNDSVKMRFKFKTPSSFEGNWANIVSWLSSNDPIISLYSMSSLNIRPLFYANKGQINIVYEFALNTEYVIELEGSAGEWTANLKQNDNIVATGTLTATEGSVDNVVYIGRKYRSTSPGIANLDFNDSYIIVNNSVAIRGTQPMTKTCSVVGCTGTPDISGSSPQAVADRNIVLNKGWELTYQ